MSYINFNPTAQQGFQNALGMGMQMGAQARQAKERREYQNALAGYDPSNPETVKPIMKHDPRLGMHLSEKAAAQQAAARESRNEGVEEFLPLIAEAAKSPESWNQVYTASANAGRDMTGIPREYDPEWAAGMMILHQAGKQGIDLTERARDVLLGLPPEQRSVNNPEFVKRMAREVKTIPFQPGGGVIEYDQNTGEARVLAGPPNTGAGNAPQQPIATQVDGVTYYVNPTTGKVYDNPQEAMGGSGGNAGGGF